MEKKHEIEVEYEIESTKSLRNIEVQSEGNPSSALEPWDKDDIDCTRKIIVV